MSESTPGSSRREFVTTLGAVAAVGVALPVLTPSTAKAQEAGAEEWFPTIKPEALESESYKLYKKDEIKKDNGFVLSRVDDTIYALSNRCTHKGCQVVPGKDDKKDSLYCPCHKGEFDYKGDAVKEPPKLPLARHAIRLNKDGIIEVNLAGTVGQDAGMLVIKKA